MSRTKISWTDETWNPVIGCTKVSEGCKNCYAEKMAKRLAHIESKRIAEAMEYLPKDTKYERKYSNGIVCWSGWTGQIICDESVLEQPLHWKKPRQIFVDSMGDLFHERVPFEFIGKVFGTAIAADWHTYQFLTKRVDRALEFATWFNKKTGLQLRVFKHIHFGTSCENQKTADERIPLLLQIPAAKRFVSFEPLLEPIDIAEWMVCVGCADTRNGTRSKVGMKEILHCQNPRLDQIIVGAESIGGHAGRECKLEWVRSLVAQAKSAGCKIHVKQLHIDGKLVKKIEQFPEDLRIQENL